MPVKQVIVMRTDLNMRKGKMIAQGAHASMAHLANVVSDLYSTNLSAANQGQDKQSILEVLDIDDQAFYLGNFRKVCLQIPSEDELLDILSEAKSANLKAYLITDSGLTEFNGVPTNTCLAIGPHQDEAIDPITGHLKLL